MNPVSFRSARLALDTELRKEAFLGGLMTALGHGAVTGAAGHVGANVIGMAGHKGNINELLAHRALQHGLTGGRLGKVNEFAVKHLYGPEALSAYQAAHAVGNKMKDLSTNQMRAALSSGAVASHLSPELRNSPILGDMGKAFEHELKGTAPELQTKGLLGKLHGWSLDKLTKNVVTDMDTTGSRFMKNAPGMLAIGGVGALDAAVSGGLPVGLAAHMAGNQARQRLGDSVIGQKAMHNLFTKGLRGEQIGKGQQAFTNYIISPGLLDSHRVGSALHSTAERMGPLAQKGVEALGTTPYGQFGNRISNAVGSAVQTAGGVASAAQGASSAYKDYAGAASRGKWDPVVGGVAAGLGVGGAAYAGYRAARPDPAPQPGQPQQQPPQQPTAPQAAAVPKPPGTPGMPKVGHEGEPYREQNLLMPSAHARNGAAIRASLRKSPASMVTLALLHNINKKEAAAIAAVIKCEEASLSSAS